MIEPGEEHLALLYALMQELRNGLGGGRILSECDGRLGWPRRGVYFISEPGEMCGNDSNVPRIVKVGTHAVSSGSRSTLWGRLRAHRGNSDGNGNHRGSIPRLHAGMAMMAMNHELRFPTWGKGSSAPRETRRAEEPLEKLVSEYIGKMTVIWIGVDDEPGRSSDRAYIERNAIGLLSGLGLSMNPPSDEWLGRYSPKEAIRNSGLWNVDHVGYQYDSRFLAILEAYVEATIHSSL